MPESDKEIKKENPYDPDKIAAKIGRQIFNVDKETNKMTSDGAIGAALFGEAISSVKAQSLTPTQLEARRRWGYIPSGSDEAIGEMLGADQSNWEHISDGATKWAKGVVQGFAHSITGWDTRGSNAIFGGEWKENEFKKWFDETPVGKWSADQSGSETWGTTSGPFDPAWWSEKAQAIGYTMGIAGEMGLESVALGALTGGIGATAGIASKMRLLKNATHVAHGLTKGYQEAYMNSEETFMEVKQTLMERGVGEDTAIEEAAKAASKQMETEVGTVMALNAVINIGAFGIAKLKPKGVSKAWSRVDSPKVSLGVSDPFENILEYAGGKISNNRFFKKAVGYGATAVGEATEEAVQSIYGIDAFNRVMEEQNLSHLKKDRFGEQTGESALLGVLGGVIMKGTGDAFSGVYKATMGKAAKVQQERAEQNRKEWFSNISKRTKTLLDKRASLQKEVDDLAQRDPSSQNSKKAKEEAFILQEKIEALSNEMAFNSIVAALEHDFIKGEGLTFFEAQKEQFQIELEAINNNDKVQLKELGLMVENPTTKALEEVYPGVLEDVKRNHEVALKSADKIRSFIEVALEEKTSDFNVALSIANSNFNAWRKKEKASEIFQTTEELYKNDTSFQELSPAGQERFKLERALAGSLNPENIERLKEELLELEPYTPEDAEVALRARKAIYEESQRNIEFLGEQRKELIKESQEKSKPENIKKEIEKQKAVRLATIKTLEDLKKAEENGDLKETTPDKIQSFGDMLKSGKFKPVQGDIQEGSSTPTDASNTVLTNTPKKSSVKSDYETFVETGKVSSEIVERIASKVASGETLSKEEVSMMGDSSVMQKVEDELQKIKQENKKGSKKGSETQIDEINKRREEEIGTRESRSYTDERGFTTTVTITEEKDRKLVRVEVTKGGETRGQYVNTYSKELSNDIIYKTENADEYEYTPVKKLKVEGKRVDKINAKYDAKIAALEKQITPSDTSEKNTLPPNSVFSPRRLHTPSEEVTQALKNYRDEVSEKIGSQATFYDVMKDMIEKYNRVEVEDRFEGMLDFWENIFEDVPNAEKIYDSLFSASSVLFKASAERASQIKSENQPKKPTDVDPNLSKNKEEVNEKPEVKKPGKEIKTSEGDLKIGYLGVQYTSVEGEKFYTSLDGVIEETKTVLDYDKVKVGTTLIAEIDEEATAYEWVYDINKSKFRKQSISSEQMAKLKESDPEAWLEKVVVTLKTEDGELVGYIHTPTWYNDQNIAETENKQAVIQEGVENVLNVRKGLLEKGQLSFEISSKKFGSYQQANKTVGVSESLPLLEGIGEPMVTIYTAEGLEGVPKDVLDSIENLDDFDLTLGHAYDIRRVSNNSYRIFNLNKSTTLPQPAVKTLQRVFLSYIILNNVNKSFLKGLENLGVTKNEADQIRQEIKDKLGIDIKSNPEPFINMFTYDRKAYGGIASIRDNRVATNRKNGERYYETGGSHIALEANRGNKKIHYYTVDETGKNTVGYLFQNMTTPDGVKYVRDFLRDVIPTLVPNVDVKGKNIGILDENNSLHEKPYVEWLSENILRTNVKSHNIGTVEKPKWVTDIQPVFRLKPKETQIKKEIVVEPSIKEVSKGKELLENNPFAKDVALNELFTKFVEEEVLVEVEC